MKKRGDGQIMYGFEIVLNCTKKAMRGILRRKVTYVLCLTEKIGGSLKYKLEKGK